MTSTLYRGKKNTHVYKR